MWFGYSNPTLFLAINLKLVIHYMLASIFLNLNVSPLEQILNKKKHNSTCAKHGFVTSFLKNRGKIQY